MTASSNRPDSLGFIGFGEAATAFLSGWAENRPATLAAFDVKTTRDDTREILLSRCAEHGVTSAATPADALSGADVAFCLVTADQALAAAEAAAPGLTAGTIWFDGNSCAPGTKRRAAEVIEAAGGRYVDLAIMAPVYPKKHHVPLLVAGPHAETGAAILSALDMKPKISGDTVGHASSIKMLRSVMIKGFEALTAECFLAARRAGVEEQVIASLEASDPDVQWRTRGAYNLERMMVHGTRRSAEMVEVARTVAELGLGGGMSAAASDWQARIADLALDPGEDDLYARADTILADLNV